MQITSKAIAQTRPAFSRASLSFTFLAFVALLWMQTLAAAARGAPATFADLVEQVGGAVVNITTTTKMATPIGPQGIVPEGSPFEDLFRGPNNGQRGPRSASALGAGFVISEDGYVVTNNHVIAGADEIEVEFINGDIFPAKIVGTDANIDIAVLKIDADNPFEYVAFGNSDVARVGDWVMAMGNPLGQGFSVSAGIISARNRELSGPYDDYIQTDAAINRGNSGGPLFNMDGEVIGVNTAIISPSGGSIGLGFSMASNTVDPVVKQLKEYGEVRRGWLGVNIGSVNDEMAKALGLDEPTGAIIRDVFDGPAKDAGLKTMDVIVMFDGKEVADSGALVRIVGGTPVGATVKTIVLRDGKRMSIDVVLGQRPEPNALAQSDKPAEPEQQGLLGMQLSEITPDMRSDMNLSDEVTGVLLLSVEVDSLAAASGLAAGDVITDAAQNPVEEIADLVEQVENATDAGRASLLLLVRRDGEPRFVVLKLN
ncbi:MAG: Do family serine endopeptidase [Rhodobacteraceae bacterium]|jgi:serine protease Do|nr:Do family serine endopeptidase [Paracoccaceae bacterium]NDH73071.1 Do family serine endopeptidase [Paracoccaceae bacterium]